MIAVEGARKQMAHIAALQMQMLNVLLANVLSCLQQSG
jgi:hypothetical protein